MKRLRAAFAVIVLALAAAAAAAAMVTAAPAIAASSGLKLNVNGSGYTSSPVTPLIGVSGLVPGSTVSGAVGVWNASGGAGSISLKFVNPTSRQNVCSAAPPPCDPSDPGHLPAELAFTISASPDGVAPYTAVWTGLAAQLEAGVQALATLGDGAEQWLRMSARLPLSAGNETQGNSFTFGVAVILAGAGGGGPIIPPVPQASPTTPSAPPSSGSTSPAPTPTPIPEATSTVSPPIPSSSGSSDVGGVSTHKPGNSNGGSTVIIPPANSGNQSQSGGIAGLASTGVNVALLVVIGLLLSLCGVLLTLKWRSGRYT